MDNERLVWWHRWLASLPDRRFLSTVLTWLLARLKAIYIYIHMFFHEFYFSRPCTLDNLFFIFYFYFNTVLVKSFFGPFSFLKIK